MTSRELKPETASKTLSTLSALKKSSFIQTLNEETAGDIIDKRPVSPVLLSKPGGTPESAPKPKSTPKPELALKPKSAQKPTTTKKKKKQTGIT